MTEQSAEPIITIKNLTCRFGKKVALDRVNFEVIPGRVFGLVGENGAGKTTLMKHLLGALTPQDGQVRVFGADPTRDPTAVLSQIGYLSEDRDLPRWMRVKELMRYTQAFFPDWDQGYAEQLRQQFRLDANTRIRSLSRGEKAKAGLLAALAHRPKLLLLDEPSSGLDAVARKEILAVVMRTVAEEGRTVVFSSHLLDEVERVVDEVAMIHEGRVSLIMPMDDLKATHQRRVVAFETEVKVFPKVAGVLSAEGEGREWAVVTHGDADITRAALTRAGASILEESVPTLDAIFVARVAGDRGIQDVA
ncbi:MAG: ABC transporter ATP-binding protein [Candidatus Hydrogenedentes bacterium]|nr:ABC transporter ATP-binding protein [Candidatus Hydrogenedentota bacterium]